MRDERNPAGEGAEDEVGEVGEAEGACVAEEDGECAGEEICRGCLFYGHLLMITT